MELIVDNIPGIIYPSGICMNKAWRPLLVEELRAKEARALNVGWEESQLNPKNRIDSLALLSHPLWRIDGCMSSGTQFFAVPLFMGPIAPMRIDIVVSIPQNKWEDMDANHTTLHDLLDLGRAFHTRDSVRVRRLGITRYILRILQLRTVSGGDICPSIISRVYETGPFGTLITIHIPTCHINDAKVQIVRNYNLEAHMHSYTLLKKLWEGENIEQYPPEVDMADLRLVRQLSDTITVVRPNPKRCSGLNGCGFNLMVFKSVAFAASIKYLYHELRVLLQLPPHPNIIKPLFIVTKVNKFGSKRGVVGFILPYYPLGSLRDHLPFLRIHGQLHLRDQLRWAEQITLALKHIRTVGNTYYPDLRLDNLLLTDSYDIMLIDFEQRGVWLGFSAPEVDFVECLRSVADAEDDEEARSDNTLRFQARRLLTESLPSWRSLHNNVTYENPRFGYNIPWLALRPDQYEAAMVYMLGRTLWCIFEGMSAPDQDCVWASYPREPEISWPNYQSAPKQLRILVDMCIGDRVKQRYPGIIRHKSKIFLTPDTANANNYWDGMEREMFSPGHEEDAGWLVDLSYCLHMRWLQIACFSASMMAEDRSQSAASRDKIRSYQHRASLSQVLQALVQVKKTFTANPTALVAPKYRLGELERMPQEDHPRNETEFNGSSELSEYLNPDRYEHWLSEMLGLNKEMCQLQQQSQDLSNEISAAQDTASLKAKLKAVDDLETLFNINQIKMEAVMDGQELLLHPMDRSRASALIRRKYVDYFGKVKMMYDDYFRLTQGSE